MSCSICEGRAWYCKSAKSILGIMATQWLWLCLAWQTLHATISGLIMPQTFAIILFLNSFKLLLLFPNPLLLFSHYSQQVK